MTNDFFDFKRFLSYLSKLWTEQRRTILISAAILLGILFVIEVWTCLISYASVYEPEDGSKAYDSGRTALAIWGVPLLYIGACISATRMFTDGQHKAGRIHVLTMPVSMFESWLARTLLFVVGYFVLFHVVFYGLDIIRYILLSSALPKVDIRIAHPITWLHFGKGSLLDILYAMIWYGFTVSFFMLGSLVFPRKPLLGTTISAFMLLLVGGFILFFVSVSNDSSFYLVTAWVGLLGPVNLWLSYRRLCELEVIDRM